MCGLSVGRSQAGPRFRNEPCVVRPERFDQHSFQQCRQVPQSDLLGLVLRRGHLLVFPAVQEVEENQCLIGVSEIVTSSASAMSGILPETARSCRCAVMRRNGRNLPDRQV